MKSSFLFFKKFKSKLSKAIIFIFLIIILFSCNYKTNKYVLVYSTKIENPAKKEKKDSIWLNLNTTFYDTLKNYCSRINNKLPYGIGANIDIPKNLCDSNIELNISADIKKQNNAPSFSLVVQMDHNDSSIYWNGINLNGKVNKNNCWERISEVLVFPKNFTKENTKIKFYFTNSDSTYTYIDNIKIQIQSKALPSYLPEIGAKQEINKSEYNNIFQNKFCIISLNQNGGIIICDNKGSKIFSEIKHVIEWKKSNDKQTQSISNSSFKFISVKNNQVNLETQNSVCKMEMSIQLNDTLNKIKFLTKTLFSDSVTLMREALVFGFTPEIKEVYKKNRQIDIKNFQNEYWLDKQGLKIGNNENTCYIYKPENISSLQLDTKNKRLIVNLDYSADHPLLHFPLKDSAMNYHEDISPILYSAGNSRDNSFSFVIGIDDDYFPRLMKNPNGYLSTYVFTEHADWTDIRTQRATYFGDSRITSAADATGGFIKYKIPVTKSVFYTNPDKIMNNDKRFNSSFNSPIAAIKQTPQFIEFLTEIKNYNIDICLHTPDQNTTTKKTLSEASEFMKKNFQSHSWIDHGYDNKKENNREDIVCDGLTKTSDYYALDILKDNGIKYFWNCYFEDVPIYKDYDFYSFIGNPYVGFGDAFPTPEYWQHSSKAPGVYFWKTTTSLKPLDYWEYFFSKQRLSDFVNNYQVEFNHCYPASIENNGFWIYGKENNIIVNPFFDNTLKTLDDYRNKGFINLTTVKDILSYWISLEDIKISNIQKNVYVISNNDSKDIQGLTLVVKSKSVLVDGEEPMHKYFNGDYIFWFDLKSGEQKTITEGNSVK